MSRKKAIVETASEKAARVGQKQRQFQRIRLDIPRQHDLVAAMEQLRMSGIDRIEGEGTRGLRVIQPSGTGKSESAKQIKAFVESQPGRDPTKQPVLHVSLDTTGTPRSAVASCLEELGDEYTTDGNEGLLLKRLRMALKKEGVELLIIDELNHCSGKTLGKDVSNTFKNMLTKGWAPIAFMGTSDADRLFKTNRELRNRCSPQLSLTPLDPEGSDLNEWVAFLKGMDEQIVARDLLPSRSDLAAVDVAEALCIACGGVIGEVCLVIEDALCAVLNRGDTTIAISDLHRAVEVRYVLEGDLDANPFDELVG